MFTTHCSTSVPRVGAAADSFNAEVDREGGIGLLKSLQIF